MMLIETAKNTLKALFVAASAATSCVVSWTPSGELLGTYDKVFSIAAAIVAIIVGIMTIINYWRQWNNE